MKIRAQIGMVLNLDKCIGCHTCSVTCKNVWTSRPGMEYAWFNNVETKPGSTVTAEELVAHCKGLLAGYKVPREIRFEPIPKTSTGKIQKFQLRERAKSASAIE